jgi:hypothetical protein
MSLRSIASAAVVSAVLSAGCDPYRCEVQSRSLQYEAELGSGPVAGRGVLELAETRGAENAAFVLWHVRASPLAAPAVRVSLREGTPEAPGRVLYDFPLINAVADSGVVTQVFVRAPYAGQVSFAELWELVQRKPVSFEVVFAADALPVRIGPLGRTGSSDWHDVCS